MCATVNAVDSRGEGGTAHDVVTIMPDYVVRAELTQGQLQALSIVGRPLQRVLKLVQNTGKPSAPPASAFLAHVAACLENKYK